MLDLKPIKDREKLAEPGPWAWMWAGEKTNDAIIGIGVGVDGERLLGHIDDPDDMIEAVMHLGDSKDWRNTDFIAHARTDIPALVAELERFRELCRSLYEWLLHPKTLVATPATAIYDLDQRGEWIDTLRDALRTKLGNCQEPGCNEVATWRYWYVEEADCKLSLCDKHGGEWVCAARRPYDHEPILIS